MVGGHQKFHHLLAGLAAHRHEAIGTCGLTGPFFACSRKGPTNGHKASRASSTRDKKNARCTACGIRGPLRGPHELIADWVRLFCACVFCLSAPYLFPLVGKTKPPDRNPLCPRTVLKSYTHLHSASGCSHARKGRGLSDHGPPRLPFPRLQRSAKLYFSSSVAASEPTQCIKRLDIFFVRLSRASWSLVVVRLPE